MVVFMVNSSFRKNGWLDLATNIDIAVAWAQVYDAAPLFVLKAT
jgi:hypothetical protein